MLTPADSRIYMVAEPLEKGLGEDIEKGKALRWVGLKMGHPKTQ
jgi:hypothetical protein